MMTRKQADAIAVLVHELRPEWDTRGVLAALRDLKDRDPWDVARAAIAAAADHGNRTPAVIALAGPHWTAHRPADTAPIVGPGREARCHEHEHELARACRPCRADRLGGIPNPYAPIEPIRGDEPRRPMPRIPAKEA